MKQLAKNFQERSLRMMDYSAEGAAGSYNLGATNCRIDPRPDPAHDARVETTEKTNDKD